MCLFVGVQTSQDGKNIFYFRLPPFYFLAFLPTIRQIASLHSISLAMTSRCWSSRCRLLRGGVYDYVFISMFFVGGNLPKVTVIANPIYWVKQSPENSASAYNVTVRLRRSFASLRSARNELKISNRTRNEELHHILMLDFIICCSHKKVKPKLPHRFFCFGTEKNLFPFQ